MPHGETFCKTNVLGTPQEPAPTQVTEPPEDDDMRRDVEAIESNLADTWAGAGM